jgi:hypothetical protein
MHIVRIDRVLRGCGAVRRSRCIASSQMSVARRARRISRRMQPQHFGLEQRHRILQRFGRTGDRRAGKRDIRGVDDAHAAAPAMAGTSVRVRCGSVGRGARRHIRVPGDRDPCAPLRLRRGHPRSLRLPADRTSSVRRSRLADCDRMVCEPLRAMRSASRGDPPKQLVSQAFRPSRHGGKYRRKASHGLRWRSPRRRTLRT